MGTGDDDTVTSGHGGGARPVDGGRPGSGARPGLLGGAFAIIGGLWRPLYGFALAVAALAACGVLAITALGFALAWQAFDVFEEAVEGNIEREEPAFSNTGDSDVAFFWAGAVVVLLLLLLVAAVLSLLDGAHAVAVRHALDGRGVPGAAVLWRHARPFLLRIAATRLPTLLCVAATALVGIMLFDALASGLIPGIERPRSPFTGFSALDWVAGLGLPLLAACVGPFLFARFSLAGSVVVFEDVPARTALRRSWRLTRGSSGRVFGIWLVITAAVALVSTLLRYAAAPLTHVAEPAMMRLSDGNVFTTATLVHYTPPAVAFALLPAAVMVPVCLVLSLLYTRLRTRERERAADRGPVAAGPPD
ncbi:hypothetical protein ACFO4E_16075 [Nocardiopsis mangrovi]|uniref:Uncharacterized protein n=1 Tax=Nocardiopsis mangrovi TaxID=1179818 RepID=A0ABV9DY47_9ACTN